MATVPLFRDTNLVATVSSRENINSASTSQFAACSVNNNLKDARKIYRNNHHFTVAVVAA